jgi:fucose permease
MHAPENWAIYSISAIWLTIAMGRIACSFIPEHVAYEKVIASLLALAGAAMALQGLTGDWRISLGLFTLAGLAFAGTWPLIVGMASHRHPRHSGTVIGITIAAGSLGCVVAPLFMNALLAALPTNLVFVAAAVPLMLGAVLLIPELRRRA